MEFPSVGATETIIMGAVLADGDTTITNGAQVRLCFVQRVHRRTFQHPTMQPGRVSHENWGSIDGCRFKAPALPGSNATVLEQNAPLSIDVTVSLNQKTAKGACSRSGAHYICPDYKSLGLVLIGGSLAANF